MGLAVSKIVAAAFHVVVRGGRRNWSRFKFENATFSLLPGLSLFGSKPSVKTLKLFWSRRYQQCHEPCHCFNFCTGNIRPPQLAPEVLPPILPVQNACFCGAPRARRFSLLQVVKHLCCEKPNQALWPNKGRSLQRTKTKKIHPSSGSSCQACPFRRQMSLQEM